MTSLHRTKRLGVTQYKYRVRPAGKTGKKYRNILHESKKWDHYLKHCHSKAIAQHRRRGAASAVAKQEPVSRRALNRHYTKWASTISNEGSTKVWSPTSTKRIVVVTIAFLIIIKKWYYAIVCIVVELI